MEAKQEVAEKETSDGHLEENQPQSRSSGRSLSGKWLSHRGVEVKAEGWSRARILAFEVWNTHVYDFALVGSIVFTIVMVVLETDARASGGSPSQWISISSDVLLALFIGDIAVRIFIFRLSYFLQLGNWVDISVVGVDFCMVLYQYLSDGKTAVALSFLRIFRLLRLGQAMHVLVSFPELHLMLKGMAGAFKTIVWGAVVMLLMLLVWSILAVQLIHPRNQELAQAGVYDESGCTRCHRAFESVSASMLTMVKHLLAGDGWGEVCVPLSEAYPWIFFFFLAVITSVSLALLNLILAVIVDAATRARSESDHDLAAMKDADFKKQKKVLTKMFQKLDKDGSGGLSWDELNDALLESFEFADTLRCMGISTHDLEMVWMILDEDDTGTVTNSQFVEQLYRLRSQDSHNMTLFIKSLLIRMRQDVRRLVMAGGHSDVASSKCFRSLGITSSGCWSQHLRQGTTGLLMSRSLSQSAPIGPRLSGDPIPESAVEGFMASVANERTKLPL